MQIDRRQHRARSGAGTDVPDCTRGFITHGSADKWHRTIGMIYS